MFTPTPSGWWSIARQSSKLAVFLCTLLVCVASDAKAQVGALAPVEKRQFTDGDGTPLADGLVYTYACGTTTPKTTYTDSALMVAHDNPIELDGSGRATIYLEAACHKFDVRDSDDVSQYVVDNIYPPFYLAADTATADFLSTTGTADATTFLRGDLTWAVPTTDTVNNSIVNGRLTLTSGTAVTTADVTSASTIYFTPYKGNRIALYDGSAWELFTFTERSLALGTLTDDLPYDVFIYDNSGTLTLEFTAWASGTARATALTLQDGVLVRTGATTRRYLGTFRTETTTTTEDSFAKRFLWNYYNRVPRQLRVTEATNTWTYTTATYQQANASTANQAAIVVGIADTRLQLRLIALVANSTGGVSTQVSIGEDSLSTVSGTMGMQFTTGAANAIGQPSATLEKYPAIGYHYYTWLERSAATGTTTWYGDNGDATFAQSGLVGFIEG